MKRAPVLGSAVLALGVVLGAASSGAEKLENYDATVLTFSHGSYIVRSFKDCQEHYISADPQAPNHGKDVGAELGRLGSQSGTNVHLWVRREPFKSGGGFSEYVVAIHEIDRTGSAEKTCVKVLATKKVRGVVRQYSQGNGSGS